MRPRPVLLAVAVCMLPACAALNPLPTTEELEAVAREMKPDLSELAPPPEPEDATPYVDDEVVERRVEAALRDAGSAFRAVSVTASSGTLTLAGTVPDPSARRRAETLAREHGGVERVVNGLGVEPD